MRILIFKIPPNLPFPNGGIKPLFFSPANPPEGISLSIPEKAKPKLFERMRNLLKSTSISSMLMGTMVLAIAANSYELLCTAGFPMVFTRILTLQNLTTGQYYLYLIMYNPKNRS